MHQHNEHSLTTYQLVLIQIRTQFNQNKLCQYLQSLNVILNEFIYYDSIHFDRNHITLTLFFLNFYTKC